MESNTRPIIVGITGGTASGKTSVCEEVFENIGGLKECTLLPLDCFYKELTPDEFEHVGSYNFDHPHAMDWDLIRDTFTKLTLHQDVMVPNYNYTTCKRDGPGIFLKCTDLVLVEGIFALYDEDLRKQMDLKIFVHSDDDIRLLRRLKRDVMHRGRTVEGVIKAYNRFVKQAYDEYIKPTMKHSDIIVPRGKENVIAIEFISENLKNRLRKHGVPVENRANNTVVKLPFDIAENAQQVNVPEYKDGSTKQMVEKIILKMINQQDVDMMPVNLSYLAKVLLEQFKKSNDFYQQNPESWQFLPILDNSTSLTSCLEQLTSASSIKHLCLFIPELISFNPQQLIELSECLRMTSYAHNIEEIHILTFFMGSKTITTALKDYQNIHFYALECNEQLQKYSCFISDQVHHHVSTEGDPSSQEKIEAFSLKGQLDTALCSEIFNQLIE